MVTFPPFQLRPCTALGATPPLPARPLFGGPSWRVGQLVAALCVLSLADLFFTIWAHRYTPFHEGNPLARALLERDAIAGLVLFKAALTALGAGIFWRLRRHLRAEVALWALDGVYVMLALRWSDYTAVTMSLGISSL